MECPKCHSSMTETQKICQKCGWERHHFPGGVNTLDEKKEAMLPPQKNAFIQAQQPQIYNENKDLLDVFIGPNSEKIKKGGFSFSAFLFGHFYSVYRKFYFLAFLQILLNAVSFFISACFFRHSLLLISSTYSLCSFIIGLVFGFTFKKSYLQFVHQQIEELKKEETDELKIQQVLSQKGGTNNILVSILLSSFLSTLLTTLFEIIIKFII